MDRDKNTFLFSYSCSRWSLVTAATLSDSLIKRYVFLFIPQGTIIRKGWVSVCVSVPHFFVDFPNWITSKRFELDSLNMVWCFVMMVCFAYC